MLGPAFMPGKKERRPHFIFSSSLARRWRAREEEKIGLIRPSLNPP
jgi:hypothetical protein